MRRANGGEASESFGVFETLEGRRLLAFTALVNFQPANAPGYPGYVKDTGAVFGNRGNGLTYGWNATNNNARRSQQQEIAPTSATTPSCTCRRTATSPGSSPSPTAPMMSASSPATPSSTPATSTTSSPRGRTPSTAGHPPVAALGRRQPCRINVTDGRLTISNGANAVNNKINFIEVREAAGGAEHARRHRGRAEADQLNWTDNSTTEQGFAVERRRRHRQQQLPAVATLPPTAPASATPPSPPARHYGYRIRAFNAVGSSHAIVQCLATTPCNAALAPAAPTGLASSASAAPSPRSPGPTTRATKRSSSSSAGGTAPPFTTLKEVRANTTSTTVYLSSARGAGSIPRGRRNSRRRRFRRPPTCSPSPPSPRRPFIRSRRPPPRTAIDHLLGLARLLPVPCRAARQRRRGCASLPTCSSLSYRDTGLTPGTSYSYRIIAAAANSAGDSAPSDVVTATTAPAAVTGLAVTGVMAQQHRGELERHDRRSRLPDRGSLDGINWTWVAYTYADVTSFTVTGLSANTTYYIRVTGFAYGPVLGERADPVTARTLA